MTDAPLPLCDACRKPITSIHDGYLTLRDSMDKGYPQEPQLVAGIYSHADCGPDVGYHISFSQLLSDGVGDEPHSWYGHLMQKRWFPVAGADILDDAYDAAKRVRDHMQRELAPMRGVVASIPRRPPRTPDNPRNIRPAMRARVMERDGFRCRRCGNGPDDSRLEVDHIIPVAQGGTAAFDNLQTLCRICNAGKSDAAPHAHDLRAGA